MDKLHVNVAFLGGTVVLAVMITTFMVKVTA